jgi:quinoprotein glucose dehydrogenase
MRFSSLLLAILAAAPAAHSPLTLAEALDSQWSAWGASPGGTRYAPARQLTPDNVADLEVAWRYSTGEMSRRSESMLVNSSAETTPILAADSLVTCTPFGRVIALDPATGKERWTFDPEIDPDFELPNQYVCRGVAQWQDRQATGDDSCDHRIIYTTVDLRLIAIDARTGEACAGFGSGGEVVIAQPGLQHRGELKLASPPTIVGDIVAVGSMILDNVRTDSPRGVVYGYDARSGEQVWVFDPIPQAGGPTERDWLGDSRTRTGGANMWSVMAADSARDLLFVPTSSPSPDYYGGERPGDNRHGNSLVALHGATGELAWAYQLVHHDIWDYDTPAQPTLVDITLDGTAVPAIVQPTKQGFLFVFDRRTGEPLFPVEERPVPQGAVAGEWLSPTQPVPALPEPLFSTDLRPEDAHGFTFWDRAACRERIEALRFEGLFTPPSLEGSIHYPAASGGANWGGAAIDPDSETLFINSSRVASVITLVPRRADAGDSVALSGAVDVSPMKGTPYEVKREFLLSPWGAPCTPPPWGGLSAYDLRTGKKRWDVPLGTINHELPLPLPFDWKLGTPNIGGPVATAGGVLFIAATMDGYLRAFDMTTGEELWKDKLPGGSQATPMTYTVDGRQYVVMATGQHLWFQTEPGDTIVAYALPR